MLRHGGAYEACLPLLPTKVLPRQPYRTEANTFLHLLAATCDTLHIAHPFASGLMAVAVAAGRVYAQQAHCVRTSMR